MRWCEGPAWFGAGRYLVWSDIPNNRMMRWQEETGRVSVFRQPSNNSNGNTRDRQGRLITCEHDTRRVTRTEFDGTITTLIDKFDGKPLNSPNDVVVKSDDSIWFTDPPFGILGNYEGHMAKQELPTNVYRLDPKTGSATVVAGDVNRPNGLAFSPDESKMYIVEAAANPRVIKVFDVTDNGTKLANGKVFLTAEPGGTPDGFRLDVDGNLWCGWGMGNEKQDGVKIFDPDGQADRLHRPAGALRQRLLRRRAAQPPVHDRQPLAVFAVREHAGHARRLTSGQQARQQRRSAVEVYAFQRQQPLLGDRAAESGEPAGLAAAGQHAMARDDDGYGIAPHGLADGARRTGVSGLPRQCAVGRRLAPADAAQRFVDAAVKGADAGEIELDAGEVDTLPRQVFLHSADRTRDLRRRLTFGGAGRTPAQPTLRRRPAGLRKLQPRDAVRAPGDADRTDGGVEQAVVHRRIGFGQHAHASVS